MLYLFLGALLGGALVVSVLKGLLLLGVTVLVLFMMILMFEITYIPPTSSFLVITPVDPQYHEDYDADEDYYSDFEVEMLEDWYNLESPNGRDS